MTWAYDDYITLDGEARRDRLRLHIREVSQAVTNPDISGDGKAINYGAVQQYLQNLKVEERELSSSLGGVNGGISVSRNRDARGGSSGCCPGATC